MSLKEIARQMFRKTRTEGASLDLQAGLQRQADRERPAHTLRDHLCRLTAVSIGCILLVAAFFKLRYGSAEEEGDLFAPAVRFAALPAEIVLGVWLLSGWGARTAWLAALVLFCGLTAASSSMWIAGRSDCGCFGPAIVSPRATSVFDVACIAALLLARPRGFAGNLRGSLAAVGGLGILVAAAAGLFSSPFGQSALARLRGENLTLVGSVQDVGDAPAGTVRVAHIELVNSSDRDIEILGGHFACSCMVADGLRFYVPAGGSAALDIRVEFGGPPRRFSYPFELFTDQSGQQKVRGRVTGTVSEPQP